MASAQTSRVLNGELVIEGQSTVRAFSCKARAMRFQLGGEDGTAATPAERLPQLLRDAQLEIIAKQLDCGDGTMNDHMLDALEAKKFPAIRFKVTGHQPQKAEGDRVPVVLEGELSLRGKWVPVTVHATALPAGNGGVRLQGRYELKMTDWGVKPPSLFFGTMNVRDTVLIRFDVTFERPAAPTQAAL